MFKGLWSLEFKLLLFIPQNSQLGFNYTLFNLFAAMAYFSFHSTTTADANLSNPAIGIIFLMVSNEAILLKSYCGYHDMHIWTRVD